MTVKENRQILSLMKGALSVITPVMILLSSIPIAGRIVGIIVTDIFSMFVDFYIFKDGRRNPNMEALCDTCTKTDLLCNSIGYLFSMSLNIASIVTGQDDLKIAALAISTLFRLVLVDLLDMVDRETGGKMMGET